MSERRLDRARTWDARVCQEATLEDLALGLFTLTYRLNAVAFDVVEENDRPLDLQLASLRFYDLKAGHSTNAGVVLFGKDPLSFFPGAYVQYVQYSGQYQADEVVQERRIVGDLLDVLRDLNRLALEIADERPVQGPDLSEAAVFDYPPRGMRELFMNAVVHRNYEESTTPILINHYSDRIEIQNPGGLYGDLTPEQFPDGTAYRNPILAEAAKVLGFVNRFGRGISVTQRELVRNGSPLAVFRTPAEFLPRDGLEAPMKTLAFFNNKGGVGKTSLVYHLSWMFAELGVNVVAMDLDPQSNLTSSFLEDESLEELWEPPQTTRTILGLVDPLLNHLGDIAEPIVAEINDRIGLIPGDLRIGLVPGDLGLSRFEDRLAETWGKCLDDNQANAADGFRVTTAFYRIMEQAAKQNRADLVLIDVGPNLGAINRAALVSADHVIIPLAADLFSLQGLRNLGPTLRSWRKGWQTRKTRSADLTNNNLMIPDGEMQPAGYVVMQPSIRENYPVAAYRRWINRIPEVYHVEVLGRPASESVFNPDPMALATLKNYRSLAPMAQEARKPMFALKPADGAIGGHVAAVQDCHRAFRKLAERIANVCGFSLPTKKTASRIESLT